MKGKIEELLLEEEFWCPLCEEHHTWAENNPDEAKAIGISLDRAS